MIYAREQLPLATSVRVTGEWTPGSRVALANVAGPDFADVWEEMVVAEFLGDTNLLRDTAAPGGRVKLGGRGIAEPRLAGWNPGAP